MTSAQETKASTTEILPQEGDWKSYLSKRGTRYMVWKVNNAGEGRWVKLSGGSLRPKSGREWTGKVNYISGEVNILPKFQPLGEQTENNASLRWPADAYVNEETDYIMFKFGKYEPPLGEGRKFKGKTAEDVVSARNKAIESGKVGYWKYKNSSNLEVISGTPLNDGGEVGPIILPMPQDFQDIMEQNWQGKQFSRVGMTALSGLAGKNFSDITDASSDVRGNLKALGGALTASGMNKIPGVGGNLTLSDVTGSVWGSVLNPNVETLYESPQQREFSMTYKLVPRNDTEANIIKDIVRTFRYAAAPGWGDRTAHGGWSINNRGTDNDIKAKKTNLKGEGMGDVSENFITVPWLCQFVFQKGSKPNTNLPIIKPCAIKKVGVNYTPDGTYATYGDGSMLSTEITLTFLETKLIFKQDIEAGY